MASQKQKKLERESKPAKTRSRVRWVHWAEGLPTQVGNFRVWHTFDTAGEFIASVKKEA